MNTKLILGLMLIASSLYPCEPVKDREAEEQPWGYHTIIDLKRCLPQLIRSKKALGCFIFFLCREIDMKEYGAPVIVHFGTDPRVEGYSVFQLIETSNISAHFAEETNSAYIDIFSCKPYDTNKAIEFARDFFCAEVSKASVIKRY